MQRSTSLTALLLAAAGLGLSTTSSPALPPNPVTYNAGDLFLGLPMLPPFAPPAKSTR